MKNEPFFSIIMNSRNELRTSAEFKLFGKRFYCDSVKIDTGCPRTTIITSRLAISQAESRYLKKQDIKDCNVKKRFSLGVNDTQSFKKRTLHAFQSGKFEKMVNVSFAHIAEGFSIGGVNLGDVEVMVNYDRIGNILIGMDVLRLLESHIKTVQSGETIFLATHSPDDPEYKKQLSNMLR